MHLLLLLLVLELVHLTLHVVQLVVKANQDPGVVIFLLIIVDASLDQHLVVTDQLGDMCLSCRWLLSYGLKLSPNVLLDIKLVDVTKGLVLALAAATKHYQLVIHLQIDHS